MCDIDKELVLRGAAYFAAYAAEQIPPAPDPFTARLIEQAILAKLNGAAVAPRTEVPAMHPKTKAKLPKKGHKKAPFAHVDDPAVIALLEAKKVPHSRVEQLSINILGAFRSEAREFSAAEISEMTGCPGTNDSGSLNGVLTRFCSWGLIEKIGRGRYKVTTQGLS